MQIEISTRDERKDKCHRKRRNFGAVKSNSAGEWDHHNRAKAKRNRWSKRGEGIRGNAIWGWMDANDNA